VVWRAVQGEDRIFYLGFEAGLAQGKDHSFPISGIFLLFESEFPNASRNLEKLSRIGIIGIYHVAIALLTPIFLSHKEVCDVIELVNDLSDRSQRLFWHRFHAIIIGDLAAGSSSLPKIFERL
jgi:hypothetical protein